MSSYISRIMHYIILHFFELESRDYYEIFEHYLDNTFL